MAYAVSPRPHIVRVRRHMILLRISQLLLAAIILALTAYGIHVLSASGIILTLVTGRPTPLSFHAEDFVTTTHGNSTNSTSSTAFPNTVNGTVMGNLSTVGEKPSIDPSKLPKLSPIILTGPEVTQALSPQILDSQAPVPGPPALSSKVQKRDKRIKPGHYFPEVMIDFRDLDLAKYCRHPLEDVKMERPKMVPSETPDKNERFRVGGYFSVAGQVHRLVKRLAPSAFNSAFKTRSYKDRSFKEWMKVFWEEVQEDVNEHENGKSYREIRRVRKGLGLNPWGSPLKDKSVVAPQWLMMGHAQTALLSILHLTLTLLTTHCPTFAKFYDYPLLLILEFFLLVLWLISFCILATQVTVARAIGYGTACGEDGYCYTYASWDKRKHFLALMVGAAALSAVMFLTYLISFILFLTSILKHRREGGMTKPLSPSASHPGPFSFDETREAGRVNSLAHSYTNNYREDTDEEAMKHGNHKRSKVEKIRDKEAKRAAKEDAKAMRNMRKGGLPKDSSKPTILTSSGGIFDGPITDDGRRGRSAERGERGDGNGNGKKEKKEKKEKRDKSYRLTLKGLERMQLKHALAMSELQPAQQGPYQRGG